MKYLLAGLLALSSLSYAELKPIRSGNGLVFAKPSSQHTTITVTPYITHTHIRDNQGNSITILRPPVRSYLYPVIDLNGNGVLAPVFDLAE